MSRARQVFSSIIVLVVLGGCGSRTEYGIALNPLTRQADDRVLVSGRVTVSLLGTGADDVLSEVCVRATWFETLAAVQDGGAGDGGMDGGLTTFDAGAAPDAGTAPAGGGLRPVDVNERFGPMVTTVEACPTNSGFELTSPQPIPAGRRIVLSVVPFESEASKTKRRGEGGPFLMRGTAVVSP